MQDFHRELQKKDEKPEVSQYPAYTMFLSTRDMARLGYLMLRKGRWGKHQIVPTDWVNRSTTVVSPITSLHPDFMQSGPLGYGYMWWIWDGESAVGPYKGAFTASGAHGQWITILPALDMVVAHKAFWSSTGGPKHSVNRAEYYRLLDLLTGARPATAAELEQWKKANSDDTPQTAPSGSFSGEGGGRQVSTTD